MAAGIYICVLGFYTKKVFRYLIFIVMTFRY
nr:MAG TPA: hypothetical protein [Caudoviricetes sp.]